MWNFNWGILAIGTGIAAGMFAAAISLKSNEVDRLQTDADVLSLMQEMSSSANCTDGCELLKLVGRSKDQAAATRELLLSFGGNGQDAGTGLLAAEDILSP
jgi:hypothetical protein